jgi:ATP-binding cassette subfamily F protein 3
MLIQALGQYDGSFITVSHNRDFISRIANKIWYIEDEQVKEFPGTFDEFQTFYFDRGKSNSPAKPQKEQKIKESKENTKPKTVDADKKLKQVETKIERLETEKTKLNDSLMTEEVYSDSEKMVEIGKKIKTIEAELSTLNESWEKLVDELS